MRLFASPFEAHNPLANPISNPTLCTSYFPLAPYGSRDTPPHSMLDHANDDKDAPTINYSN